MTRIIHAVTSTDHAPGPDRAGDGSATTAGTRSTLRVLPAATLLICALGLGALGAGEDGLDSARSTLEKWVETRRAISQEKLELARSRETLTDRIGLVEREIEALRTRIGETRTSVTDADTQGVGLREENALLKSASTSLGDLIATLEARAAALLPRLPEPIRERVKPLSQRFPDDPATSTLSTAERFQNVVGVLNEINKFNGAITMASEVRQLPDGTSAEVTALYLGIGQGYYVNASGTAAGVGTGVGGTWVWTPANEAAPRIAEAIAILKNEQVAGFVKLPIAVR